MNPTQGHLPAITGIRGAAALLIVVFHMFLDFNNRSNGSYVLPGLRFGWIGVDLFFVLSGFLLAWVLWSRPWDRTDPRTWGSYATQRALRILPTYWVALLATLVMVGSLSFVVEQPGAFLQHLLLFHLFDPSISGAVNPLYWTLAVELHFYLILPFLLPLFSRRLWPYTLTGAFLFTILWRWWFYAPETGLFLFYMPAFLSHFAVGVVVARLVIDGYKPPLPAVFGAAGLLLFVMAPLLIGMPPGSARQATTSLGANLFVRPLVAIGFAMFLWAAWSPSLWQKMFSIRPLVLSGKWSYSIYLIHVPLLVLLREYPIFYETAPWLYMSVGMAVSVIGGYLLYRLVEHPMNRLRYRLRGRGGKATSHRHSRMPDAEPSGPSLESTPQ